MAKSKELEYCGDLDDFAWKWTPMHAEGMEAMSRQIHKVTSLPMEDIIKSMKHVYGKVGTFDFKELLQNMPCLREWHESIADDRDKLKRVLDLGFAANSAYKHQQAEHFKMYPGMRRVLRELKNNGVTVNAFSDSPVSKAKRRLMHFGILPYFDRIIAREDPKLEEGEPDSAYEKERKAAGFYDVDIPVHVLGGPKCEANLADICGRSEDFMANRGVVGGDSFESDMKAAHNNDCYGILSNFKEVDPRHVALLHKFGPKKVVQRNFSGINPSEENFKMIVAMRANDRLLVADEAREVLEHCLRLQQAT